MVKMIRNSTSLGHEVGPRTHPLNGLAHQVQKLGAKLTCCSDSTRSEMYLGPVANGSATQFWHKLVGKAMEAMSRGRDLSAPVFMAANGQVFCLTVEGTRSHRATKAMQLCIERLRPWATATVRGGRTITEATEGLDQIRIAVLRLNLVDNTGQQEPVFITPLRYDHGLVYEGAEVSVSPAKMCG